MARPSAFHHRCSASRVSTYSMSGSLLCKKVKGERRVSRTVILAHVRPCGPSTSRVARSNAFRNGSSPRHSTAAILNDRWHSRTIAVSRTAKTFKRGGHVEWNSEADCGRGVIPKRVVSDLRFKGYVHHATKEKRQYFIKSEKTDHIAIHKGAALRLLRGRLQNKAKKSAKRGPKRR